MSVKRLSIIGLLIALSFILANIKFAGSIALDSVPAFLALFVYKNKDAAFIGGIAHLLSAALAGFALGILTHICIALLIFIMLLIASYIIRMNNNLSWLWTSIFIILFNSFISPLILFLFMPFTMAAYWAMALTLVMATIINVVIALILSKPLKKVMLS